MRRKSKYNLYNSSGFFFDKYPIKVLSFKRPKWLQLKKKIKTVLKKKTINLNFKKIKLNLKFCEKLKKQYKLNKLYKKVFFCVFDFNIKYKSLKKNLYKYKDRISLFNFILFKSFFRLDILLWKLNFCKSSFEARQLINAKKILINGICSYLHSKYVSKGDVLKINDSLFLSDYNLKINYSKLLKTNDFFSFLEIDYYTGTVIIIKDLKSFSFEDYTLLYLNYIDANKYKYIS